MITAKEKDKKWAGGGGVGGRTEKAEAKNELNKRSQRQMWYSRSRSKTK